MTTLNPQQLMDTAWAVPSESNPGAEYIVEAVNGGYTCTCKGFEFTGNCKHIAAVKEAKQRKLTALGMFLLTGGKVGALDQRPVYCGGAVLTTTGSGRNEEGHFRWQSTG